MACGAGMENDSFIVKRTAIWATQIGLDKQTHTHTHTHTHLSGRSQAREGGSGRKGNEYD